MFAGATLADQRASLSALVLECFVMVGMNIENFDVNDAFIMDVRKEYDSLHFKLGAPHNTDSPDVNGEQDDEANDDDYDEAHARGAGADASSAAAAADIANAD